MTGRVFKESSSIYDDQAQILFDYFKAAADQIVSQEMGLEQEIRTATESGQQIASVLAQLPMQKMAGFIGGGVGLVLGVVGGIWLGVGWMWLGIILAVVGLAAGFVIQQKIAKLNQRQFEIQSSIDGFKAAHAAIRRDYKVHKLGVAYVPVARVIPFEDKTFEIDLTGSVPRQDFRLSIVRRGELFTQSVAELESLITEAPVVEESSEMEEVETDQYSRSIQHIAYYDYIGSLDRTLRSITFSLDDLEVTSVGLPVIAPNGELANYLATYAADEAVSAPLLRIFDADRFNAELETFRSLNDVKKALESRSAEFEGALRRLMLGMAQAVQSITALKIASTNQLMDRSNRLLFTLLKASYNHYSPRLEAEEIDRIRLETFDYKDSVDNYRPFEMKASSRVLFDLPSESWLAEDGSRTTSPFGMNQIHEEVIAPIIQNLMAETRVERQKIYNAINDQKINYLNQWHQDTEDFYGRNRAESADLINLMRSTFTEFIANYNALRALENTQKAMERSGSLKDAVTSTEDNAAELVASYDAKSREFQSVQEDFSDYIERLKEDIDRRASRFSFIQYYDASLRDSGSKSFAEAATSVHSLDARRKALVAVNPFFASSSQLPPAPAMEQSAFDGMALNLPAAARSALAEIDAGAAPV
jgi:hypothetical protein